jgi:hypothetical protein
MESASEKMSLDGTPRSNSPGIDKSVLGSHEFRAPWKLGLPYPLGPRQ